MDYRLAKVPRPRTGNNTQDADGDESMDEEEEEEEEEEYFEDETFCWPQGAAHAEHYFGHVFDAGDHRLCEFLNPIV